MSAVNCAARAFMKWGVVELAIVLEMVGKADVVLLTEGGESCCCNILILPMEVTLRQLSQAFTDHVHSYDCAGNMHTNIITCT